MYNNKTTENFIFQANLFHHNKYDYSLVKYINARTKVKIICKEHGEFEQIPRFHILGNNCPKCSGVYMDKVYFKNKATKIHKNKYDYSLVNYINNRTLIEIICQIHGSFFQKPKDHLLGKGCSICGGKNIDTTEFIRKSQIKHNDKYDYSLVKYINAKTKVDIICKEHGEFKQTPNSHLSGKGCPNCNQSKGELKIKTFLEKNKIYFIQQKRFIDCKNIKPLPFDFYLPDLNLCIEYQGEQHYKPIKYFGGNIKHKKTVINDIIKLNYCSSKKINLIIINDVNKIDHALQQYIS